MEALQAELQGPGVRHRHRQPGHRTRPAPALYPASIAADVSPERLARFFIEEPDGSAYRIHKVIRDMLVFSEQDVIKDPPFSKLDLISCRNLLIYLGRRTAEEAHPAVPLCAEAERRAFSGHLRDRRRVRRPLCRAGPQMRSSTGARRMLHGPQRTALGAVSAAAWRRARRRCRGSDKTAAAGEAAAARADRTARCCSKYAPVGVLVNDRGDILYLHGRTGQVPGAGSGRGRRHEHPQDGPRRVAARPDHRAAQGGGPAGSRCDSPGLAASRPTATSRTVNLTVRPVAAGIAQPPEPCSIWCVLEEAPAPTGALRAPAVTAELQTHPDADADDAHRGARGRSCGPRRNTSRATHEELETSNEELKSSNEEMQSVNEELQSTNEELETSKEELQSVNEELATVNAELQTEGGRPFPGQQRHEQPAGRHRRRHGLRRPRAAHHSASPRRPPS